MMRRRTYRTGQLPENWSILHNLDQGRGAEAPFTSVRLPLEMQWLKSLQVLKVHGFDAIHFGKAANSRACGGDPMSDLHNENVMRAFCLIL
jgi:hypothetical protein